MAVPNPLEQYIRQAALQRGIDPDIAVRVAMSEGGLNDPVRQSDYRKGNAREPSYGPFQLLVGGEGTGFPTGMGNDALARGIDPRNPDHWQKGVDFALEGAKKTGWSPWYGAAKAGIDRWEGLSGNPNPRMRLAGDSMVPRDHSAQIAGQTSTPFGSMFPGMNQWQEPPGIDPAVAQYAFGDGKLPWSDRLKNAGKAFDEAMPTPAPGGGGFPGGPSQAQATGLLALMQSPNALARMMLQRRMG